MIASFDDSTIAASSRAVSSWLVLPRSTSRCAVTLRKIKTQPDTFPSSSRIGAALSSMGHLLPFL
jgi:hypothetical protein